MVRRKAGQVVDHGAKGAALAVRGLIADTWVATPEGWSLAADLRVGQQVMTHDRGAQAIVQLLRSWLSADAPVALCPMQLPVGAMGNSVRTVVLPDQLLLVQGREGGVLMPAVALDHWRGVTRAGARDCPVVVPVLATARLVRTSGDLWLACPGQLMDSRHPQLSAEQGRHMIASLMAEEVGRALRGARP